MSRSATGAGSISVASCVHDGRGGEAACADDLSGGQGVAHTVGQIVICAVARRGRGCVVPANVFNSRCAAKIARLLCGAVKAEQGENEDTRESGAVILSPELNIAAMRDIARSAAASRRGGIRQASGDVHGQVYAAAAKAVRRTVPAAASAGTQAQSAGMRLAVGISLTVRELDFSFWELKDARTRFTTVCLSGWRTGRMSCGRAGYRFTILYFPTRVRTRWSV